MDSILPDHHHLDAICNRLWAQHPNGRAAVMVGAGFSRNAQAISEGARDFETWLGIIHRMEDELGRERSKTTSDALRLGEEFRVAYGQQRLEALIKDSVPDEDYDPGLLHRMLLELPWADVLTTNYDTLLERSTRLVPERKYSVVVNAADLPNVSSPRIVKLHGSFRSNRPFIFTEEDYRTYPKKFAPFVNLVQQTVIENLLCLIGFSGEDPNFLQWIGWVRDNLGQEMQPIYLVGVFDLKPSHRSLLESRCVRAIDLAPLFPVTSYPIAATRQKRATEWFLRYLFSRRPSDPQSWPLEQIPSLGPEPISQGLPDFDRASPPPFPSQPAATPARQPNDVTLESFAAQVTRWRRQRDAFPGWIICPFEIRSRIWNELSNLLSEVSLKQLALSLDGLPASHRIVMLEEFFWRLELSYAPIPSSLLVIFERVLNEVFPHNASPIWKSGGPLGECLVYKDLSWERVADAWMSLAFGLLAEMRIAFDGEKFREFRVRVATLAVQKPRWSDRQQYERALELLQRFAFNEATQLTKQWSPGTLLGSIWKARILQELGDTEKSKDILLFVAERTRLRAGPNLGNLMDEALEGCALQSLCDLDILGNEYSRRRGRLA